MQETMKNNDNFLLFLDHHINTWTTMNQFYINNVRLLHFPYTIYLGGVTHISIFIFSTPFL